MRILHDQDLTSSCCYTKNHDFHRILKTKNSIKAFLSHVFFWESSIINWIDKSLQNSRKIWFGVLFGSVYPLQNTNKLKYILFCLWRLTVPNNVNVIDRIDNNSTKAIYLELTGFYFQTSIFESTFTPRKTNFPQLVSCVKNWEAYFCILLDIL